MYIIVSGCDSNPLGGSKSNLSPDFEPGKHTPSAPPVIGSIPDYIMDENDVYTIPFTIGDPDSFMICSFVFVKATSSNEALIDSNGLVVGGTYPNCTLTMTPKALKFGAAAIKVDLYDFWSHAYSNFNLTVVHITSPGVFLITDAEGRNNSVDVTWQNAAYMQSTGAYTSPHYTLFYRPALTSTWTSIPNVTSPYLVTGLTNGITYDFYVEARNSMGFRNSQTVQAEPTRFKIRGGEFIAASTQFQATPGTATNVQTVNATMVTHIDTVDSNYPTLSYSAAEVPANSNIASGSPKPSSLTTPSGKYKVYVNSQGNILSGDGL